MPLTTGQSLGSAYGAIFIDTSDVEKANVTVRRVSGEIEKSFDSIGTGVKRGLFAAGQGIKAFGKDIESLRGEISAASLAAAGLAAVGIKAASGMQAARIQLTGMMGSAQAAAVMIDNLRQAASAAGIPFQDMLKSARLLLPTLKGNTDQLDRYLSLARRVAVLNPEEGIAGASFAINEAVSSGGTDLVSLSERFQISRFALREALAQTGGDFAEALDLVLNQMGITQDTADEMGKTFEAALGRAADAAAQLAGTAFEPLLTKYLIPLLEKGGEWLTMLQNTNPAILELGAALTTVVAVGGPLLLMLSQVISSLQTIRGLSIAGTLGHVGAAGLAVAGGVGIGIAGARAIGRATGNESLANSDLAKVWEILKMMIVGASDTMSKINAILEIGFLQVQNVLARFVQVVGEIVVGLAQFMKTLLPEEDRRSTAEQIHGAATGDQTRPGGLEGAGRDITAFGEEMFMNPQEMAAAVEQIEQQRMEAIEALTRFLFPDRFPGGETAESQAAPEVAGYAATQFSPEEMEAWRDFQADLKQIEADAQADRLKETKRYEEQRTDLIAAYEERAADIAEATKERITAIQDQIAEIQAASVDRQVKVEADRDKRLAKIEEDAQKDEIRRIEDFQREERRARLQHMLTLLSAASRLDARAIIEEQERYAIRKDERKEEFDVETQRRAEDLQARLEQEHDAAEERLEEARQADEKRLNDLQNAIEKELALEQRKLAELEADKIAELEQYRLHHIDRMNQIEANESEARNARQAAFDQEIIGLGGYWGQRLAVQNEMTAAELESFRNYLAARVQLAELAQQGGTVTDYIEELPEVPQLAGGGSVPFTGLAMLHGTQSRPETMLSADTTASLNRMLGGSFDQGQLLSAVAGGAGGGSSKSLAIGAVNIYTQPGMNESAVYGLARKAIEDAIEEMND